MTRTPAPDVTIVMATHNRRDYLVRALDALAAQRDVDFDAIIVDDASTDGTSELLDAMSRDDARFSFLVEPVNRGPAAARNCGWKAAVAPWVAFTDDDCVPTAEWLRSLIECAAEGGADIVQGRTVPNPQHHRESCWDRTAHIPVFSGRYQTCNLLVRRSVLEQLGGFDERYSFAGEDAEFGLRAVGFGARATFASDALVHHAIRPGTFGQHLRERKTWAELVRVFRDRPEARDILRWRVFYRWAHVPVVLGGPVLVWSSLKGYWWSVPLAALGYAAQRTVRHARPHHHTLASRAFCSCQATIALVWEVLQFVRASVRYRTLVL